MLGFMSIHPFGGRSPPLGRAPPAQNYATAPIAAFILALACGSCGGELSIPQSAVRLPTEYAGPLTLLFDDEFESGILGYRAKEVTPARPAPILIERAEAADSVVRARPI